MAKIEHDLLEYCMDLQGEEQGHQEIDWPEKGKVKEGERI